jgi:hypothetical protein
MTRHFNINEAEFDQFMHWFHVQLKYTSIRLQKGTTLTQYWLTDEAKKKKKAWYTAEELVTYWAEVIKPKT